MKEHIAILYNVLEEDKVQEGQLYKDVELIDKVLTETGYLVGRVHVDKNVQRLVSQLKNNPPNFVFNLCEEVDSDNWGEIYITGILELMQIPYTGSKPFCLALALHKAKIKDILVNHDIPTPKYQVFNNRNDVLHRDLNYPLIVKPLYEDGSFGIEKESVVSNQDALYQQINKQILEFDAPMIVEEYIEGREFNIALLGNRENLRVLPIAELDYSNMPEDYSRICSYKAKWEKDSVEYKGTVPVCPAAITQEIEDRLKKTSVDVYNLIGCNDYARVDIRLSKDNIPYVIDINPNPCISPDSGYVNAAKVAGLEYKDLINEILECCRKRNPKLHEKEHVDTPVTTQG